MEKKDPTYAPLSKEKTQTVVSYVKGGCLFQVNNDLGTITTTECGTEYVPPLITPP